MCFFHGSTYCQLPVFTHTYSVPSMMNQEGFIVRLFMSRSIAGDGEPADGCSQLLADCTEPTFTEYQVISLPVVTGNGAAKNLPENQDVSTSGCVGWYSRYPLKPWPLPTGS